MRFRRRREPEPEPQPARPSVEQLIADAREMLGDVPAVNEAAENPTDAAALNGLVVHLHERMHSDDSLVDEAFDLHSDLLIAKLDAQGVSTAEIRGWSLAELTHHGLQAPPSHFPTILEAYAGHRRSVQDVVDRSRALHGVLAAAFGQPADEILATLTDRGLLPWVSDQERQMLEGTDNETLKVQITWRSECLRALGWALQIHDTLPLDGLWEPAPEEFAPVDPEADAGVPADVQLRPERELMARLDVFYCAHWAVRNHELTGEPADFPKDIVPGAVWERRHALEWLLSGTEWDEISLDT